MKRIFKKKNVIGYGSGKKIIGGSVTDIDCLTIMVTKKVDLGELDEKDIIPVQIDGIPTDVIETGEIRALGLPTDRWRPAPGGVSIGHYAITAGTLGCIVTDNKTGAQVILSNNHVLANSNEAAIGDAILQPGPYDGGSMNDQIAALLRFVPVTFGDGSSTCPIANTVAKIINWLAVLSNSSHRVVARKISQTSNYVDAALAIPLSQDLIIDEILNIGNVSGSVPATVGMEVKKMGRTTGFTIGNVTTVNVTVQVSYGAGKMAIFEDQIALGSGMSQGGDSGSLVVSQDNQAVGLLFAGSDTTTIISPIHYVTDMLDVTI